MLFPFPLLMFFLALGPDVLLPVGTLLGSLSIPVYIITHMLKLSTMKPGTEGWNPVVPRPAPRT